MSPKLTDYHNAILRYLAGSKTGKRRSENIYDEFVSKVLHEQHVKTILKDLERCDYLKPIDINNMQLSFAGDTTKPATTSPGYKITELGKSLIGAPPVSITSFSNITNSAIANNSPGTTQTIKISEQPEDIQLQIAELRNAIIRKDSTSMKKAFGYIADKSVDVAIALTTGTLIL